MVIVKGRNHNMADYYFRTEDLKVGYEGRALLEGIDICLGRGEILTLVGPNGAGKSTILKSITKQLRLLGGRVIIGEKELPKHTYQELSRKMAVVLTERVRPELMTCRDIVATGRYPYTGRLGILGREDEEKVDEAMELVKVKELGSRFFTTLSDGQKQRVLLARAICQEPEILVLDEPTSFLDIKYKLELLAVLRKMAKERGITVIMSLHEIDLAGKVSDKVMPVKAGCVYDYGYPEDIFREEFIRQLYDFDKGSFDPVFGSIELPKAEGEAETMVISACGRGIPVYRRLQKEGIPFIAGILYRNDVDCRLARYLARRVILEEPFRPISDPVYREAKEAALKSRKVIYTDIPWGSCNERLRELLEEVRSREEIVCEYIP